MENIRGKLLDWIKANDTALPATTSDTELLDAINSFGYTFTTLSDAYEELG